MRKFLPNAVAAAALAVVPLVASAPASASAPPKLPGPSQPSVRALSPRPLGGYWQLQAEPGQVVHLTALVTNAGPTTASFRIGPTGAGTGPTTGVGYTWATGPTSSWLTGLPASVALGPHQSTVVHATLRVPSSAKPAYQYVGGVEALGAAAAPSGHGTVRIAQRNAAVVAWVATTGTPRAATTRFEAPFVGTAASPEVVFPASNTGQELYAPEVRLSVRSGACRAPQARHSGVVFSVARQWSTTVPGTSWAYPVYLRSALPAGTYCAVEQAVPQAPQQFTFHVTAKQQKTETTSPGLAKVTTPAPRTATSLLWPVLVGALALLAVVLVLVLLAQSRRRRS